VLPHRLRQPTTACTGPYPQYIYDVAHTPLYVAIDHKHFEVAEVLINAGVMMCEEKWCCNITSLSPLSLPERLRSRLSLTVLEPPSLQHIARHCLLRHFGQQILTMVPVLKIPKMLKDSLSLLSLMK